MNTPPVEDPVSMTMFANVILLAILGIVGVLTVAAVVIWREIRAREMQHWLGSYVFPAAPSGRIGTPVREDETVHAFIAICDHYEPEFGKPSKHVSIQRVDRWVREYPELFARFHDSDGRVPQHTFFFPQDEYAPEYLDRLAELCDRGFGDVDVHLHHDGDTAEELREKLESFRETLDHRHGLLRQDPATGEVVYGFIHGNWALCNSRVDGRWCGVDQELTVLMETGCYADFTMPSAPSDTQTRIMNSIYYARDLPGRRKSHDSGLRARVGQPAPPDHLLMVQGPLLFDWTNRKRGLMPRIENGDIHAGRPASWRRLQLWLKAGVHVAGRPNWKFIKLHTHGCKPGNIDTLLGPEMQDFHAALVRHASENHRFRYHYVTAWEMAQLVHRAEGNSHEPDLTGSAVLPALV